MFSVFVPNNGAMRAFLSREGLTEAQLLGSAQQLGSLAAYHATLQPLAFADLGKGWCLGDDLWHAHQAQQAKHGDSHSAPQVMPWNHTTTVARKPVPLFPPSPPALCPAARFPLGGQQVQTQLPGALLTISSTGPASEANGSTPIITIGGYASSASLLRSNILVCKAVLHVVDTVLLVGGSAWGQLSARHCIRRAACL